MEALLVLVSFIFMLVRKRPTKVIDTMKELAVRLLPYCIGQAENTSLKGDEKKRFALDLLRKTIQELGYECLPELIEFAGEQLEVILSTPQKKGIKK